MRNSSEVAGGTESAGSRRRVGVQLARLCLEQKRTAEARAELRAALRLEPGHAEARRLLETIDSPPAPPQELGECR